MRAGICTTIYRTREVEFRTDVAWMQRVGVRGLVLGGTVYFAAPAHLIPQWLFRHELEHAYQIMREGSFRFYLKFFLYSVRYGYYNNPYEVEARQAEQYALTNYEEQTLCKLKEG